MEESINLPLKTENLSTSIEVFPLLSPVMEAELLKGPWPKLEKNSQSQTTTSLLWEENFQDLSDWCVEPQSTNRFLIQPLFQKQQDYPIGEDITFKNSGVKDNNDNLSNNKSELKDIAGVDENWTVDTNSLSVGMSSERSLPVGQDQLNTITDFSEVWMDPMQTTAGIDEPQIIDSMKLISNDNGNLTDPSLELIGETIENWFPIISTVDNISCNTQATNIHDDIILDECPSTSALASNDHEIIKKQQIKDFLLPADLESESFDLLSYVFNESGNILEQKNTEEKVEPTHTLNIAEISRKVNKNTKQSKTRKDVKINQARTKAEPYVPPLIINLKNKTPPTKKRKLSKNFDQESVDFSDSDSEAHTSSDYNYRELREKNNKASRKSRINKKVKESEMMKRANELERDNAVLKMKVNEMEKLVITMRTALLQSALKIKKEK